MGLKYDLSRIGSLDFEQMVQSLVKKIEPTTIICGAGRDDQREFFVHNADFEITNNKYAHGYTVGQVKYKSSSKADDVSWVRQQLKEELDGFRKKQIDQPQKIPETYLFFTNVVLTPVGDVGGRDRIEKFKADYQDIIPNILVFGGDDICAMLDNNRDVARCYTSFIMPGDVLYNLNEYLDSLNNKKMDVLIEYTRQMFREDSAVHLEQAGSIADKSINLRNVYTDLEFHTERSSESDEPHRIAKYILSLGDTCHRRVLKDRRKSDHELPWSDHLIRGMEKGNIILLGNAGQGKSTVCQYICQIYRACLLKRYKPTETLVESYLYSKEGMTPPIPKCERFPIMVSLKRYAAWINEQGADGNHSVLGYMANMVGNKASIKISIPDFRNLLSGLSWIFFFDGLDEVPASSNRSEVLNQIQLFLRNDLIDAKCDCLTVCTSRPQGYDNAFSKVEFEHFEIMQLSKSLCRDYMTLLLSYLVENSDERDRCRTILWKSLEDLTVSKLMTTPLYTAIIVLLVKVGGTPPKKRYNLFQKYSEVVVTREQQKQLLPQVNEGFEWVYALHGQIAFLLQLESESPDNAAAEMSATKCKEIIGNYLEWEDEDSVKIEDIYTSMVTRLPFLSEVVGDNGEMKVVFPLRSIQEYYAAEWIIDFSDDDTRREILEIISVNVYWRNVYLFVNGSYATKDRNRVMNDAMFRICSQNNGDARDGVADAEAQKMVLQGSWLALDVLQDESITRPRDWHGYMELAAKLLDTNFDTGHITERFIALPERYEDWLLNEIIIPSLENGKCYGNAYFNILWGIANKGNQNACIFLDKIIENVLLDKPYQVFRLILIGYKNLNNKILHRLFFWVTEKFFTTFSSPRHHMESEIKYWEFLLYCKEKLEGPEVDNRYFKQALYRILSFRSMRYGRRASRTEARRIFDYLKMLNKELAALFYNNSNYQEANLIQSSLGTYHPLVGGGDIRLQQRLSLFKEHNLDELVAMTEFFAEPSYSNFRNLITELCLLSIDHRRLLFNTYSWHTCESLLTVSDYMMDSEKTTVTEEDTKKLYEKCIETDSNIRFFLGNNDYISLIKGGYLNYLYHIQYYGVEDSELLKIFEAVIEQANVNDRIIPEILVSLIERGLYSDQIWAWGKEHLSSLISSHFYRNSFLVIEILKHTSDIEWLSGRIQFPEHLYYCTSTYYGREDPSPLLHHFFSMSSWSDCVWKFYSIIPSVFSESFLPNDIIACYHKLKSSDNQAAIFGFILCLLGTDKVNTYYDLIKDDLNTLLQRKDSANVFMSYFKNFSLAGKTLIMKLANTTTYNNWEFILHSISTDILEYLERNPINSTELLRLSDEGHSYK